MALITTVKDAPVVDPPSLQLTLSAYEEIKKLVEAGGQVSGQHGSNDWALGARRHALIQVSAGVAWLAYLGTFLCDLSHHPRPKKQIIKAH